MYNLLQYNSNYSDTTNTLSLYSKDEATYFNVNIENTNSFRSFKYKAKLLGSTEADLANLILKSTSVVVLLKYLSNFWSNL